jgi:phospholipid/cholesterol/gamma-HCH transport system substrate-binding protein
MNTQGEKFKTRLGAFVLTGILLFVAAIFFIGKQKFLFSPIFPLNTYFTSVSGLQVGNNVRYSGINVGTVDHIEILNDSVIKVRMLIQKNVQPFIKTDSEASIGSEGIIGDRIINISNGGNGSPSVEAGFDLSSTEPVETDAILLSLQNVAANAEIITEQLAEVFYKINSGKGTLGKLLKDTTMAENIDKTIENLKQSSKGLNENMEAAKHNFLLKGYFKKKQREAEKKKKEEENNNVNKK